MQWQLDSEEQALPDAFVWHSVSYITQTACTLVDYMLLPKTGTNTFSKWHFSISCQLLFASL